MFEKIRGLIFKLDPETAHNLAIKALKFNYIPHKKNQKNKILELDTYFTSGPEETRACTIPKNCKAPKAAGEIHTDFEKGFIKAETISYKDFVANNGWVNSRVNGKMRLEGKDYIVKDGDVLNFRFNT